jgi:leader peptidase (prepilin peptidase) / N-methyltransferase
MFSHLRTPAGLRYLDRVSPALVAVAAVLAAASGWPASAIIFSFSVPAGIPAPACPACAASDPVPGPLTLRPGPAPHAGRRHCRACGAAVGPSPLLLAVPLALLAAAAATLVHPALVAAAACWLVVCAVPLAAIDVAVRRLPDALTGAAFGGTAAFLLAAAAYDGTWPALARAGGGALAVAAFFTVIALARPGSAGLGDAKMGLSVGALAGWLGWDVLVSAVFAGFLLAGVYGLWLLAVRRARLSTTLAYGPFLLAGCLVTVLLAGGTR